MLQHVPRTQEGREALTDLMFSSIGQRPLSFRYHCSDFPRPNSLEPEDNLFHLKRHSSLGPNPKLNGDVNKNGLQVHITDPFLIPIQ